MKKMLISLVIEGESEKELIEAKTTLISACAGQLVSVTTNVMEEPRKELELFAPTRKTNIEVMSYDCLHLR